MCATFASCCGAGCLVALPAPRYNAIRASSSGICTTRPESVLRCHPKNNRNLVETASSFGESGSSNGDAGANDSAGNDMQPEAFRVQGPMPRISVRPRALRQSGFDAVVRAVLGANHLVDAGFIAAAGCAAQTPCSTRSLWSGSTVTFSNHDRRLHTRGLPAAVTAGSATFTPRGVVAFEVLAELPR
jgi:hypothetical protein